MLLNIIKKFISTIKKKRKEFNAEFEKEYYDTYNENFNINETFIDDNNLEGTLLDYVYNDLIDSENSCFHNTENLILEDEVIEKLN